MRLARLCVLAAALLLGTSACGSSGADAPTDTAVAGPVVWVAAEGDDALTLLDGATGDVVTTVTGVAAPHNVQATPAGDGVWVTSTGGVLQLDATSLRAVASAPSGSHPAHVVAGPDGSVWVTAYGDGAVLEHTGDLDGSIRHRIGGGPHGMRISPDVRFAAVANHRRGTLDLVDLSASGQAHRGQDGSWVRSVRVGASPVQTAVSADSRTVFVSVAGTSEVVRVDVASGKVTGRVRVPSAPAQIWVTSDGLLLSADQGAPGAAGDTLSFIDAESMQLLDSVRTGNGPHGIVVDEAERRAWVTNSYDASVSVVDLERRTVTGTFAVGNAPNGITLTATVPDPLPGAAVYLTLPGRFAPRDDGHDHGDHDHGDEGDSDSDGKRKDRRDDPAGEQDDDHGHDDGEDHAH